MSDRIVLVLMPYYASFRKQFLYGRRFLVGWCALRVEAFGKGGNRGHPAILELRYSSWRVGFGPGAGIHMSGWLFGRTAGWER